MGTSSQGPSHEHEDLARIAGSVPFIMGLGDGGGGGWRGDYITSALHRFRWWRRSCPCMYISCLLSAFMWFTLQCEASCLSAKPVLFSRIILYRQSMVSDVDDEVVHVCIYLISCESSCWCPFNDKLAVFQLNQSYFHQSYLQHLFLQRVHYQYFPYCCTYMRWTFILCHDIYD